MNVKELIASNSEPTSGKIEDYVEPNEIVAERTVNAKIFNLGGNKRRAKIYSCPVHYKDVDGKFKSIDPSVKKKKGIHKYQYEVNAGNYHAHFDKNKPWNYKFEIGDKWIEFEALFEESESLIIDVKTSKIGVKEIITLLDKDAPNEFRWKVKNNGITPIPSYALDIENNIIPVIEEFSNGILSCTLDVTNAVYPIVFDPSATPQATNDGYIRAEPDDPYTYALARDRDIGTWADNKLVRVGQNLMTVYFVNRGFLSFAIPEMGECTAATLYLNGAANHSDTDFEIYIHSSTYLGISIYYYKYFDGRQTGKAHNGTILNNTWNSSSYSSGWNTITFNADGRAAVLAQQDGTLKICLISKEDFDNDAPLGYEYVDFDSSYDSGTEPFLSITYKLPGQPLGLRKRGRILGLGTNRPW